AFEDAERVCDLRQVNLVGAADVEGMVAPSERGDLLEGPLERGLADQFGVGTLEAAAFLGALPILRAALAGRHRPFRAVAQQPLLGVFRKLRNRSLAADAGGNGGEERLDHARN